MKQQYRSLAKESHRAQEKISLREDQIQSISREIGNIVDDSVTVKLLVSLDVYQ